MGFLSQTPSYSRGKHCGELQGDGGCHRIDVDDELPNFFSRPYHKKTFTGDFDTTLVRLWSRCQNAICCKSSLCCTKNKYCRAAKYMIKGLFYGRNHALHTSACQHITVTALRLPLTLPWSRCGWKNRSIIQIMAFTLNSHVMFSEPVRKVTRRQRKAHKQETRIVE